MDKEYFLNAGIPPPLPNPLDPLSSSYSWQVTPSTALEQLRCSSDQCSNWFLSSAGDQYNTPFESDLNSMVSSPAASNPTVSTDDFAVRELIGKLSNMGEISPQLMVANSFIGAGGGRNNTSNTPWYSTHVNSPPKLCMPKMNQFVKENLPNLANSVPLNSALPELSADPGFAERAAKFSCFGSRSFNGRTNQFGLGNPEFLYGSSGNSSLMGCGKLPRVLSTPSLKADGSPLQSKNAAQIQVQMRPANGSILIPDQKFDKILGSAANSNEESSVSEQIPSGEIGTKTPSQPDSRKRKGVSKGKSKADAAIQSANAAKGAQDDNSNGKRPKPTEAGGSENGGLKTEEPENGHSGAEEDGQQQAKANQKPLEQPKDYIHVRARRGQATDSHSLAERVRREKISERMRLLQDLVPGCNKVTGKALMLDEIINYVQSLQRQVEFLSMKLASVNPTMDINVESLLAKDVIQPSGSLQHPSYPFVSLAPVSYEQKQQQTPQVHTNLTNEAVAQCTVDPSDAPQCHPLDMHLSPVNFVEGPSQSPTFGEYDLQSFV